LRRRYWRKPEKHVVVGGGKKKKREKREIGKREKQRIEAAAATGLPLIYIERGCCG
jgi:hypothetical protein